MLTTTGRWVVALALVLCLLGAVSDYPEVLALGITAVIALIAAGIWMLASPTIETSRTISPARVVQGEGARAVLDLRNTGGRRSLPVVATESVGTRRVVVTLPSLGAGQRHTTTYALPTDARGVHTVGPLVVGHADPLRLMRTGRSSGTTSQLRVHPRSHLVVPLPTGSAKDLDGPTSSTAPQGGVAFHTLREYVPGDPLRLISWKATARVGQLMVRHHVVPNEPRLLVVLDTSAAPYEDPEVFEDAVRVAASFCLSALANDYPLEVRTTGGSRLVADRNRDARSVVLDVLAEAVTSEDDPGLASLVGMIPHEEGVSIGVVTGQLPAEGLRVLSVVRPRFQMASLVQVGERFDRPPLSPDGVFTVNARTSEDFAARWNARVSR